MIDDEAEAVFNLLVNDLFTCYWCGGLADMENIGPHVDNCLREIRWLNKHVAGEDDAAKI